jgi:glycosyltransferase involved in cell wall biosynthesis
MPVVIKEAMARGVPVVATAITAIPEMVDDEVGALVQPDDVDALAAAVLRLLEDDALRTRLGKEARKRVEDRFALADEVRRLHTALERMVA